MNCHLCGKAVVRLISQLQKTHKWTKEQSKEFKNSASHCKEISRDEHGRVMINDDIACSVESCSMEPSPPSTLFQTIIEPLKKLSWEEMDKLEYDHKQKVNRILDRARKNFQATHDQLENSYKNLHHELAFLHSQARAEWVDRVDGDADIDHELRKILKPSVEHIRELFTMEMYRIANLLAEKM